MNDKVQELKQEIVEELKKYQVVSNISIEELADIWIDKIKNIEGRKYVETFGVCPICMDCPKNCPLDR